MFIQAGPPMPHKVEDGHILTALAQLTEASGYAPSLRELADRVGLKSTSTIFVRVNGLKAQGWVEDANHKDANHKDANDGRRPVKTRTLRLTAAGWREIGQTPFAPVTTPRVQRVPVFRSSAGLACYLEAPAYRQRRAPALCLTQQQVEIVSLAQEMKR